MEERTIRVIYGADGRAMARALLEAADAAAAIPRGAEVVLKPNLAVAAPPEQGATTHTSIVEGVIEYLRDHGAARIVIAEGSWVGDSTRRAFRVTGLDRLAEKYGARLADLKEDRTASVETPIGPIQVCRLCLEAEFLINLPVLKGHCQTVMTCALKNLKGCLPDGEKRRFHRLGLIQPIAALASALRPDLTLVDSLCGDLNFEDGGNPVPTNRMYLGRDPVQLDAYGCELMGLRPAEVEYLPLAERYGAGRMAWTPADIVQLNQPQPGAAHRADSRQVRQLARPVTQDAACSACCGSLIRALYQYRERTGRAYDRTISIGQGFRGRHPAGLGIGNCCRGADRAVPGCPPTAAEILAALLD